MNVFLQFSAAKLRQLSGRIEVCLDKLSEDQIWLRHSKNENAIGNLVIHLCGNVRQWIGSGVAGLPDARDRDSEFNTRAGLDAQTLKGKIHAAVEEAAACIEALPESRLADRITAQKYDVTVLEAIYHVVEHFAEHAGQIVFATKLLTGQELGFYTHLKQPAHTETVP